MSKKKQKKITKKHMEKLNKKKKKKKKKKKTKKKKRGGGGYSCSKSNIRNSADNNQIYTIKKEKILNLCFIIIHKMEYNPANSSYYN